jgi:hypothetical protein
MIASDASSFCQKMICYLWNISLFLFLSLFYTIFLEALDGF